jgi:hypothetical protein
LNEKWLELVDSSRRPPHESSYCFTEFLSAPWLMTDGIYFFSALVFPRNPATTSSSAYVNEDRFVAMATREATSFDNLWGEFE